MVDVEVFVEGGGGELAIPFLTLCGINLSRYIRVYIRSYMHFTG